MLKKLAKLKFILTILTGVALYSIFNADLRERYIINHVKDKVVYVLDPRTLRSGSTGFFVKAKSGKTVIMTNEHVCHLGKDGQVSLKINDEDFRFYSAKIIEESATSDLCIIESPFQIDGLTVASGVSQWEKIFVVGHPSLENLTLTEGQVTSFELIQLVLEVNTEKTACEKRGGNFIQDVDAIFGEENFCIKKVFSARTTANVFPGNSGSPVVNKFGNVVGVLFAGNDTSHFGYFVPTIDVRKMLEAY